MDELEERVLGRTADQRRDEDDDAGVPAFDQDLDSDAPDDSGDGDGGPGDPARGPTGEPPS